MKELRLSILLLLGIPYYAAGQAYTSKGVINYAKAVDVAKLDPSLSHQPLDEWVRSGPPHLDAVQWAVSDCDLKPPNDYGDWPLCAKFWLHRHSKTGDAGGWGLVQVGTTKKGITGAARLKVLVVSGTAQMGKFSDSEKLSDLSRLLDEASASQRITMHVPPADSEQYYLVSFDQSRASAKEVERWMRFAENGYYNAGVSLSGCDNSAATRMRKDLEATRRISDQLERETYPPQLSTVVDYFKGQLRLQLWLGEQEIGFAETGALPQADPNGTPACHTLAKLASRERTNGGCSAIGRWIDCILRSSGSRLGRYPEAGFQAFLNSKGIHILKWQGIGD